MLLLTLILLYIVFSGSFKLLVFPLSNIEYLIILCTWFFYNVFCQRKTLILLLRTAGRMIRDAEFGSRSHRPKNDQSGYVILPILLLVILVGELKDKIPLISLMFLIGLICFIVPPMLFLRIDEIRPSWEHYDPVPLTQWGPDIMNWVKSNIVGLKRIIGNMWSESLYCIRFLPFVFIGSCVAVIYLAFCILLKWHFFLKGIFFFILVLISTAGIYVCFLPLIIGLINQTCRTVTNQRARNLVLMLIGFTLGSFTYLLTTCIYLFEEFPLILFVAAMLILGGFLLIYVELMDPKGKGDIKDYRIYHLWILGVESCAGFHSPSISSIKTQGEKEIEDFQVRDMIWSSIAGWNLSWNLIAGIFGIYILLRLRGFKLKSAVVLAFAQVSWLAPIYFIYCVSILPVLITPCICLKYLIIIFCLVITLIIIHLTVTLSEKIIRAMIIVSGAIGLLVGPYLCVTSWEKCREPVEIKDTTSFIGAPK